MELAVRNHRQCEMLQHVIHVRHRLVRHGGQHAVHRGVMSASIAAGGRVHALEHVLGQVRERDALHGIRHCGPSLLGRISNARSGVAQQARHRVPDE